MPSYIPRRVKRAKQQIAVRLYEDQLAMLDSYGRFIDDSRDYIISRHLSWCSRKTENSHGASSNAFCAR